MSTLPDQAIPKPHVTVVLAVSADGKIADKTHAAARFGSSCDRAHLETQIAQMDGVLLGAGTLRAYGTSLTVRQPELLAQRQRCGLPSQPVHIVCSRTGNLTRTIPFFEQSFPRWLLTTTNGAQVWAGADGFDRILVCDTKAEIDWQAAFAQFTILGLNRVAALGGGELVASLFAAGWVDEVWFTLCPLILGGRGAPSPVGGDGFLSAIAPRLELLDVRPVGQEVFLHYKVLPTA